MAEFLVFIRNAGKKTAGYGHWMDDLTLQQIQDKIVRHSEGFQQKYDQRVQAGDILRVAENGHWTGGVRGFHRERFVVLAIPNMNMNEAQKYTQPWRREVSVERILNDETNHIYDYRFTVQRVSMAHDDELFSVIKDRLNYRPPDITVIARNMTMVILRHQPLLFQQVIDGTIPVEMRIAEVREKGKHLLGTLRKKIKDHRYKFDLANIPQAAKDLLISQGWVSYTKAQVAPYLIDKVL